MRIGFDAKRAFFNFSGLGNYSRNTIRQLGVNYPDHDYFLYTPRQKGRILNQVLDNQQVVYPESRMSSYLSSLWRSYWLGSQLEKDGINLYHGLSNEIPFGIHKYDVRSVVTIHDLIFLRFPQWYKFIDRKIYTRKSRYACENADRIIAISRQTKSDIIEYLGIPSDRIDVVYQGCDPAFYHKLEKSDKKKVLDKYGLPSSYLLNVGTIEPRKNLLQIVKAIHTGSVSVPLVVIGRPTAYAGSVKQYIADNLLEHIYFLENVPSEDLPALYQGAEVFIYPSTFEGFGIPILEALSSGTPVITSKGGCFPEAGGESTLYIDPDHPGEISAAILKILDDSGLRKSMSEKGSQHAEKFSNDIIAGGIMDVYKKLL